MGLMNLQFHGVALAMLRTILIIRCPQYNISYPSGDRVIFVGLDVATFPKSGQNIHARERNVLRTSPPVEEA